LTTLIFYLAIPRRFSMRFSTYLKLAIWAPRGIWLAMWAVGSEWTVRLESYNWSGLTCVMQSASSLMRLTSDAEFQEERVFQWI